MAKLTVDLQEKIATYCKKHKLITSGDKIVIGVSGGPDSVCLLALLKEIAPSKNLHLHVAHLNHTLRGQAADDDATFVSNLAQTWGLAFTIHKQDVADWAKTHKLPLEEAARQTRYLFLARVANLVGANKIAVGHNANDQVETILMHFLRGAGLAGLRGILPHSPLNLQAILKNNADTTYQNHPPLTLIRPLLNTPRADIESFCQSLQVVPKHDASNQDPTFFRNKIRHKLLPFLEDFNPNIHQALQRMGRLMAADYEVLQNEAERAWQFVVTHKTQEAIIIDRHNWQILALSMQRAVLRRAVLGLNQSLHNLEFNHIEQALSFLKKGQTGGNFKVGQSVNITIEYDTFILSKLGYKKECSNLPHIDKNVRIHIKIPGITPIPNSNWVLHSNFMVKSSISTSKLKEHSPWQAYFDAAVVGNNPILRNRQSGDVFYPFGLKGHRQRIKDMMINKKIPANYRNHLPLLVSEAGQICWVCGYRTDHRSRVAAKTKVVLMLEFKQKA